MSELFDNESVDTLSVLINSTYNRLGYTSNKEKRMQIIEYARYLERIRDSKIKNEVVQNQNE